MSRGRRRSLPPAFVLWLVGWLLGACGGEPTEPAPSWTVRDSAGVEIVVNRTPARDDVRRLDPDPLLVLGRPDTPEEGEFGHPVDARFLHDGGVVVADGGPGGWQFAVVFDSAGGHVASCGGAGGGPGLFERLGAVAPWPGDSIAAWDAGDGTVVVIPVFRGDDPAEARRRRARRIRETECETGREIPVAGDAALAGLTGRPAGGATPDGPFPAEPSLAALPGGGTALAPGRPFELRLRDAEGRPFRVVRRAWTPDSVRQADREAWVAWHAGRRLTGPETTSRATRERLLRELPWPATKPATSDVVVAEDGSLWVEAWRWARGEVPPDPGPGRWSVFSPRGRWVGDVEVPGRFLLTDVRGERVVGIWLDGRGGSEVRVYRLGG